MQHLTRRVNEETEGKARAAKEAAAAKEDKEQVMANVGIAEAKGILPENVHSQKRCTEAYLRTVPLQHSKEKESRGTTAIGKAKADGKEKVRMVERTASIWLQKDSIMQHGAQREAE